MALKIDYSLRLPDGQFFPAARNKSGIAIHHTVGGTAFSTVAHWLNDRTRSGKLRLVGTAFFIDRDGTVCQVFPPTAWAFQFGLKWPAAEQMKFEQRFIGIELASEGGLLEVQRQESALTVRRIRKTSDLQTRLDSTFPEMAR